MSKEENKFMGKKLEDLIVTLPLADGTEADFGVYASFSVNNKNYFALLPFKEEKVLDFTKNFTLYEVAEDEEKNPIILYIESDYEYAVAANYFAANYLDKN